MAKKKTDLPAQAGKKPSYAKGSGRAKQTRVVNFIYELGTMRKLMRIHRQVLLTDDMSDSITSHSYRVGIIGWFLAKEEKVDPYKVIMMGLLHDIGEIRSNDHNWVHKRYMKIFEEQINEEQLGPLPYKDLKNFADEYHARKSKESIVVKDADLLDQLLLLREYEWAGNHEARIWLHGKGGVGKDYYIKRLKTKTAQELGKEIYKVGPSDWWNNLWTPNNR